MTETKERTLCVTERDGHFWLKYLYGGLRAQLRVDQIVSVAPGGEGFVRLELGTDSRGDPLLHLCDGTTEAVLDALGWTN